MTFLIVGAALALLLFPAVARRVGRRLRPRAWRRITTAVVTSGAVALEAALLLQAVPTLLRAFGAPGVARLCERMLARLAPGGPVAAWSAAGAAMLIAGAAAFAYLRARSELQVLRIEATLGTHVSTECGLELAVLPTHRPIAYSRRGRPPQVVISEGVLGALDEDELAMLLRHERAHLDRSDERTLLTLAAVKGSLGWVPGVRRSIAVARLAIERLADEDASGSSMEGRLVLAGALEATLGCCAAEAAAAFTAADGLAERMAALRGDLPQSRSAAGLVYGAAGSLSLTLVVGAGSWFAQADRVVAMAGSCIK